MGLIANKPDKGALKCQSDDDYKDERDEKSSSEANDKGEEEKAVKVLPTARAQATPSHPPTVIKEMEETFLRLGFSQAVVLKLVEDQGRDSP